MNKIAWVLVLTAWALGASAATKKAPSPRPALVAGTVSRVIDGDTLWLKVDGSDAPLVVRIEGIDAPESCQPGGAQATAALTELALGRAVSLKVATTDEYGRSVGKVFDGGKDIGDRMVRDGQAWSSRYKFDRGPYVAEERMAIALQRGLHAAGGAIQPREFRQRHGPCDVGASPVAPLAPGMPVTSATRRAQVAVGTVANPYRCDGRSLCSQMTSCAEATWFLQNCPGVKMDGNRDGVPCEKQWCSK